ncbi:MAG: hypothetical protein DWQ04_28485 [Chloroflexi bacterium]|nr:MAG: hypothetical protein DWQ04_28485 [Chloroflexota bacterium]
MQGAKVQGAREEKCHGMVRLVVLLVLMVIDWGYNAIKKPRAVAQPWLLEQFYTLCQVLNPRRAADEVGYPR